MRWRFVQHRRWGHLRCILGSHGYPNLPLIPEISLEMESATLWMIYRLWSTHRVVATLIRIIVTFDMCFCISQGLSINATSFLHRPGSIKPKIAASWRRNGGHITSQHHWLQLVLVTSSEFPVLCPQLFLRLKAATSLHALVVLIGAGPVTSVISYVSHWPSCVRATIRPGWIPSLLCGRLVLYSGL